MIAVLEFGFGFEIKWEAIKSVSQWLRHEQIFVVPELWYVLKHRKSKGSIWLLYI